MIHKYRHILGYIFVVLALVFSFAQIHSVQNRLNSNVQAQLANRVANVALWCDGINATRDYQRKVAAVLLRRTGIDGAPLVVPNLNCAHLEAMTASSGTK